MSVLDLPVLFLLKLQLLVGCSWMSCIHDDIDVRRDFYHAGYLEHIPDRSAPGSRVKRDETLTDKTEMLYQPLRIHTHYGTSTPLSMKYREMMRIAVERATQKLSNILSVVHVEGPLLLPRTGACGVAISRPAIHKGKCIRMTKGYRVELCLDMFRIPEEHLEGFYLYNSTNIREGKWVYDPGPGVKDADVILYVSAIAIGACLTKNRTILSFASHCRVDKTGRPIAGLVNFCPQKLMRSNFTQQSIDATALHEILHVLGFSSKLFNSYKRCTEKGACKMGKDFIVLMDGQHRLTTPTVVNKSRQHFGCYSEADFGGPLDTKDEDTITSHWDSYRMRTSVMTPTGDNTSNAILDPITLAAFKDYTWYNVNFDLADLFLWGRDAGCSFAMPGHYLAEKEYFCTNNSSGCHFLLQDKGVCDAHTTGKQYGTYVPLPQGSCTKTPPDQTSPLDSLEVFSSSSRCFWSSVTSSILQTEKEEFVGRCYERYCTENGTLFIRPQGTEWLPCPDGEIIQVPGLQGEIQCPKSTSIMCMENTTEQTTLGSTPLQGTVTSPLGSTSGRENKPDYLSTSTIATNGVGKDHLFQMAYQYVGQPFVLHHNSTGERFPADAKAYA